MKIVIAVVGVITVILISNAVITGTSTTESLAKVVIPLAAIVVALMGMFMGRMGGGSK